MAHACVLINDGRIEFENDPNPIYPNIFSIDTVIDELLIHDAEKCVFVGDSLSSDMKKFISEHKESVIFLFESEALAIRSLSDVVLHSRCPHKAKTNRCGVTVIVGIDDHYYVHTFCNLKPDNVDYTSRFMHDGRLPDASFNKNIVRYSTEQMIFVGDKDFLQYAKNHVQFRGCGFVDHKNDWNYMKEGAFLKAQSLWPSSSLCFRQPMFSDDTVVAEGDLDYRAYEDSFLAADRVVSRSSETEATASTDESPSTRVRLSSTVRSDSFTTLPVSESQNSGNNVLVYVHGRNYVRVLYATTCIFKKHGLNEIPNLRGKIGSAMMLDCNNRDDVYHTVNTIVDAGSIYFITSIEGKLTNFLSSEDALQNPADYVYAVQENTGTDNFFVTALEKVENGQYFKIRLIKNSVDRLDVGDAVRLDRRFEPKPLILLSYKDGDLDWLTTGEGTIVDGSFAVKMDPRDGRKGLVKIACELVIPGSARCAFL